MGAMLLVVVGLATTMGVATPAGAARTTAAKTRTARLSGEITVSAAASLTEAFTRLGAAFQRAHRGTTVRFNFGASSVLAAQIQGGAPADVFASADGANMQKVVASHLVRSAPADFAANLLTIVVKKGNPKHVIGLADLANVGIVAECAVTVPCGKYAAQMLSQDGVSIPSSRVTLGQDVKATLTAVSTGDADAGIVYVTDAKSAAASVTQVKIPASLNVLAVYPIASLRSSQNTALAQAWVRYVLSSTGQKALAKFGFLPAPAP